MSSAAASFDLQIVNNANLQKIENFLNAAVYQENLEYSSNFNTRLCLERRTRLPFFDPQTGVAQNRCSLFMAKRQRMPGFREGQIYSYPGRFEIKSLAKTIQCGIIYSNSMDFFLFGSGTMAKTSTTIFNKNVAPI